MEKLSQHAPKGPSQHAPTWLVASTPSIRRHIGYRSLDNYAGRAVGRRCKIGSYVMAFSNHGQIGIGITSHRSNGTICFLCTMTMHGSKLPDLPAATSFGSRSSAAAQRTTSADARRGAPCRKGAARSQRALRRRFVMVPVVRLATNSTDPV